MPKPLLRCLSILASVVLLLAAGCGSGREVAKEHAASTEDAIIGGVAVNTAAMNAVGALVTITRYPSSWADGGETLYYGQPFCSATLIGPMAVLTAKHCVANLSAASDFGFAIGPDARTPARVVPVLEFETESTITGGFVNMGSDVAVLHLATRVDDIESFGWGALDANDTGKRFVAVGYGTQDVNGTSGTRRAGSLTLRGTEGKVFELAFGSFAVFKANVLNISDINYEIGDANTPDGEVRARSIYDSRTLLAGGYEALAGNLPGDAQICHGDSGGPLVRRIDGRNTVFGVSSWVQHSTLGYSFCAFVNVFATFGPATTTFIAKALDWKDVCDGLTVNGRCDGDVAVRCAAKTEGPRRALRTDCAELGLTCGAGTDGQVSCVSP